ncbi:ornithine cyclodeaminase family protein [Saccharopolyspora sp. WRP15-2]|uniref:Ornithine cyclodeaminase family protein n=1 Tax=Saccharopolyspora oryzae TaxID=2997343 RepID=A0ABT4UTZ4_9PSEU|nr:ornithine cyclodeaminase family protein [Saccharopolyspora oryzae]MDA3625197.1 ornithine cyclodeaminase family protein [Saccharopolyspora oryzae]
MPHEVLHLSADEVDALFDVGTAIESQRAAFTALGNGLADVPGKVMDPSRHDDSVVFCYASRMSASTGAVCKFGSLNPGNQQRGLPSVSAMLTALDPETGQPVAIMDGRAVTTNRTAGASAVAADALAVDDAGELAVLGSGVQGQAHVRAIARVRPLRTVRMWSPSLERCTAAAEQLSDELSLPVEAVPTAEDAVTGARIVATCTLSTEPVVRGDWLAPGCTVLGVGSFEPTRIEVDRAVLRRANAIVLDEPETGVAYGGPVIEAVRAGYCTSADVIALGDVLVGRATARSGPEDIVFYNSVGIGVQDAAAAWAVLDRARQTGTGTRLRW